MSARSRRPSPEAEEERPPLPPPPTPSVMSAESGKVRGRERAARRGGGGAGKRRGGIRFLGGKSVWGDFVNMGFHIYEYDPVIFFYYELRLLVLENVEFIWVRHLGLFMTNLGGMGKGTWNPVLYLYVFHYYLYMPHTSLNGCLMFPRTGVSKLSGRPR